MRDLVEIVLSDADQAADREVWPAQDVGESHRIQRHLAGNAVGEPDPFRQSIEGLGEVAGQ